MGNGKKDNGQDCHADQGSARNDECSTALSAWGYFNVLTIPLRCAGSHNPTSLPTTLAGLFLLRFELHSIRSQRESRSLRS